MAAASSSHIQLEKRIRSLRKAMSLDFQPLRDTLSRALGIPLETEAAVYCTSCVEAFCQVLFDAIVQRLEQQAFLSNEPLETKISVHHLQLALRSHHELVQVTNATENVGIVMDLFLEEATMEQLLALNLLEQDEAQEIKRQRQVQHQLKAPEGSDTDPSQPPLSAANSSMDVSSAQAESEQLEEEEEAEQGAIGHGESDAESDDLAEDEVHDLMRMEWQKRADDPFSDVDFARILKCVHPAFTLQYNAMVFLSALIREFLNEFCQLVVCQLDKANTPTRPKVLLLDHVQPLLTRLFLLGKCQIGSQMASSMANCLQRFRLQSAKSKTLSIRVQLFPSASVVNSSVHAHATSNDHSGNPSQFQSTTITSLSTSNGSLSSPSQVIGFRVARDTLFQDLLPPICKKFQLHCSCDHMVLVYRSQSLDGSASAGSVGITNGALVFLVVRKWWHEFRRNEARRGLMSSVKSQPLGDLKTRLDQSQSKVKLMLTATASGPGGVNNNNGTNSCCSTDLDREEDKDGVESRHSQLPHHRGFPMAREPLYKRQSSQKHHHHQQLQQQQQQQQQPLGDRQFRLVKSKPVRAVCRPLANGNEDFDPPQEPDGQQEQDFERPFVTRKKLENSPRLGVSCSTSELPCSKKPSENPFLALAASSSSTSLVLPAIRSHEEDSLSALLHKQRGAASASSPVPSPSPLPFHSPTHAPSSPSTAATIHIASLSLRATQVMAALDDAWLSFANLSGDMREVKDKFLKLERDQQDAQSAMPWSVAGASSVAWQHAVVPLLKARLDQFDVLISQTQVAKRLLTQLAQDTAASSGLHSPT